MLDHKVNSAYDNIIEGILASEENPFVAQVEPWAIPYTEEAHEFWRYAAETEYFEDLLGKVRNFEYRNYIALNTEGREIEFRTTVNGIARYMGEVYMGYLENDFFRIRNIDIRNDVMHVEGSVGFYGITEETELSVFIEDNGKLILASTTDRNHERAHGISMRVVVFRCDVPLNGAKDHTVKIKVHIGRHLPIVRVFTYDRMAPIDCKIEHQYLVRGNWYVTAKQNVIKVGRLPSFRRKAFIRELEKQYMDEVKYNHIDKYREVAKFRSEGARIKASSRKPIVIFSDRIEVADDNSEAIFRYVMENKRNEIDAYYVISSESPDYERMKQYGPVLDYHSDEYKKMILAADMLVTSHASEAYRNPFGEDFIFYRDMLHKPYVVSEHGVSLGKDFHKWFNRSNRMIDLLMIGVDAEYDMFMQPFYGFREGEIVVTGLPRFDYHEASDDRMVTIMPTWRQYLGASLDPDTHRWTMVDDFENTRYVTFVRTLMNSPRLRDAAAEHGYTVQFKVHPAFRGSEHLFGFNEDVRIADMNKTYKEIFAETSLLVTDYSSVAYDYAYTGRPLIYAQFDFDDIDDRHVFNWDGEFSFERDGLGEVESTVDGVIDRIIEYMENDCRLKPEYEERINNTFRWRDKDNSARCYAEILKLLGKFE